MNADLSGKTLQELEEMEGVGKSVAGKIIEYVERNEFNKPGE